ncbi:MAG: 30S ribosomal protein S8 [Proteobacteria bacterium]|nr:30S ribosomal protein S8 [Pseudomonadota bacterium]
MMTDPLADMLTRIRNAGHARHAEARCPKSKLRLAVAKVLQQEGFLADVREDDGQKHPELVLSIRYASAGKNIIDGLRRVSRPGRRVYVGAESIPKVRNGLGMSVLSTSRGVLCDRDARAAKVGGEVLCEVW